ncbi:hypothetical protein EOI86_16450 [Hwanghaeella grinnelliae]|uniref:Capsular biosynthesis protein n=1 Tax=Hwanghaeella grinnelliae TaxID=2500179 RepID=A0A3S2VQ06_9PROT|nr:hypothetical protein [Hwanghaeella grinnelliae]RVU36755.1 hypothetical protein EOI86_16450 [Hwanghaeella grinnelliae]
MTEASDLAPVKPKSILVFSHSELSGVLSDFLKGFKSDGAKVTLVCKNQQEVHHYEQTYGTLFDAIETTTFRYDSLLEPLEAPQEWIDRAKALEHELGFRFTHLLLDDRHLGTGFLAAGTNYRETRWSRAATYPKALRAYVSFVEFFKGLLQKHDVDLVLQPNKSCCVAARGMGIAIRYFVSAGYEDYYYWTENEFMEHPTIAHAFEKATVQPDGPTITGHYKVYLDERAKMIRRFSTSIMLKNMTHEFVRYFYYHLRRYEKRKGLVLKAQLREHFDIWDHFRTLQRNATASLQDIENVPFVYFPLSVEPEVTLTRESPEFNHQPFAIQALAKELPAGTFLVVKEHLTSVGARPADFYKSLRKMPNVIFIDPMESGLKVMDKAAAVATINGTSGFEAAVKGIPLILFGMHANYRMLSHVKQITSWTDIGPALDWVFGTEPHDIGSYAERGKQYLQAVVDVAIDMHGTDLMGRVSPELLDKMRETFDASFQQQS